MIKLSASRLKTLKSCSWIYHCKYILKLPDQQNSGSLRGTGCHAILEFLKKPRRKKIFKSIIKSNSIAANKAIVKWVKNYCQKVGLNQDDYLLMDQMILVGLKWDYFFKGCEELIQAEKRFDFEGDGFTLTGFIDTMAKYKKKILIRDFKTSKEKFNQEELGDNIQALMYLYIAKQWFPTLSAAVEFLFLKFPDAPSQIVTATESQLIGVEAYFKYITEYLENFGIKEAESNFAYDQGYEVKGFCGRVMCGRGSKPGQLKKDGTLMWSCSLKFGFDYYAVYKEGKLNRSYFTREEVKLEEGETVKKMIYEGCSKFNNSPTNNFQNTAKLD